MWDTEIWMQPVVLLMNPGWSEQLLAYRYLHLSAAKEYAQSTGNQGSR